MVSYLQDIVENEDIKLDMMFIASLVHDLIKVRVVYFYGQIKHVKDSKIVCYVVTHIYVHCRAYS